MASVTETRDCIQTNLINVKHVWKIEKFRCHEESELSTTFFVGDNKQFKWRIDWKPPVKTKLDFFSDNYSVNIKLESSNRRHVRAKYSVYITDATESKKCYKKKFNKIMDFKEGSVTTFKDFIFRYTLFNKEDNLLPDGNLILCCEGFMIANPVDTTTPKKVHKCKLTTAMENLFESQTLTDIKLRVQGTEIPAHKAILAARSPVFAAMFAHDTLERKESCVEIKDIKVEVIQELLRYLYTGHAPQLKTMAGEILPAADKYCVEGLKLQCEGVLSSSISIQNACSTLILASMHSCEKLRTQVVKFITPRANEVSKTPGWEDLVLNHPTLLADAYLQLASQSAS